ncbi:MAG: stage V sporulation protein E [Clostridiaceae bacterium]|nr:stage V sporulation protein E [Clostridiaceae bacterium]
MKKAKIKLAPFDFVMFSIVMLLVSIGVVMVLSASAYMRGQDYTGFFVKQLFSACLGTMAMVFTQRFDYHNIKKYTTLLMFISVVLLIVVLFFSGINGATRWIPLGPLSLQPSEIAKFVVVLYMAKSMDSKGEKIKSFFSGVIPILLVSSFFAGLILIEHNLSIAAVIMIVTVIMLFAAGSKIMQMFIFIPPLVGAGVFFIVSEAYRLKRVTGFLHPFEDRLGKGYQLVQSLLALGSGGILGVGLGRSRQKALYLPEPNTDFIFSVIGEELGIIGCIFIIILFIILIWRGIRTAINSKDTYGNLLAVGITSVIAVQAIINIAVVTGSMPVTGVPLPFISYGGSSLLFNMMSIGVLLNISRQANTKKAL